MADIKAAAREAEKSQVQFREMLEQRSSELQEGETFSKRFGKWVEDMGENKHAFLEMFFLVPKSKLPEHFLEAFF